MFTFKYIQSIAITIVVGFYFSAAEKSALEQIEGGPCSIIAPVQAFMIKRLLTDYEGLSFRDTVCYMYNDNLFFLTTSCSIMC